MTDLPSWPDWTRIVAGLLVTAQPNLTPAEARQMKSFLDVGEPRLALEFLFDFLVETDNPVTRHLCEMLAHAEAVLGTDRGLDYIRAHLLRDP